MSTTSSATGDIKNNVSKLLRELKRMNMKIEPNIRGLLLGIPSAFLPILHSSLMSYSLPLAQHLASLGIELYGRSDLRFVEGLYKVLRDVFDYHPKISRTQFLSIGFAECKIILTVDLLKLCHKKHMELSGVNPHKTHFKSKRHQQQQHRSSSSIGSSFSTVHTVAPSAGIGSVWQEAVPTSSSSTSSITPKPHLPLSPPVSPVQLTRANKGPVIIPEPVLELTPMSTPMKTTSSTSINHSSSSSGPSVDHVPHKIDHAPHSIDHTSHLVDHVSHDKEVDVSNMLNSNGSDVEIVTVESDIKLDGDPLDEENVSHSIIANNMGYISEVTKRIEDTMELLDRLTGRMTFAESQLKVLQDKGVKVTFRDISTQTDPLPEGQPPGIEAPPVMTSSPRTNVTTPILVKDTPTQYSRHRHYSSSSSSSSSDPPSPVKINFNHPIDEEDTKKILTSLRTRAQQTKELLNKANHPTVTDLLINPVN